MLVSKSRLIELAIIVAGLDALSALPAKTKKSVRIESPTGTIPPHAAFHDVDEFAHQRMGYPQFAGSPTPISPAGFSDNLEGIGGDVRGRREETDAHSIPQDSRKTVDPSEPVQSPSGAPVNPFSKTLATIEPQQEASGEPAGLSRGALVMVLTTYLLGGIQKHGV
jgi:hypothetical protein